jgi:hypothetical protein
MRAHVEFDPILQVRQYPSVCFQLTRAQLLFGSHTDRHSSAKRRCSKRRLMYVAPGCNCCVWWLPVSTDALRDLYGWLATESQALHGASAQARPRG